MVCIVKDNTIVLVLRRNGQAAVSDEAGLLAGGLDAVELSSRELAVVVVTGFSLPVAGFSAFGWPLLEVSD